MRPDFICLAVLTSWVSLQACVLADAPRGQDLLPVLARAHAGKPLRVVTLGGSITQAGGGWIGPWLREQFPAAPIAVHNAGMSATGSSLGIFRLDRDVISFQPDLVIIEYAVNDGGLSDEGAIRYVESIVVRLKSLRHPPAIVFLEAAARGVRSPERHQRVAAHYGLLDVDLQMAVDQRLAEKGQDWSALMSDNVHPNEAGHALYAQTIGQQLAPFVQQARQWKDDATPPPLPQPLSRMPLLLDGRMVPMPVAPGWREENSLPYWWNRFFNGVISADKPGTTLVLPVRGTMIGLLYPLDKSYGAFDVNVDGGPPQWIECNYRDGYDYTILASDLPACEHVVRLAVTRAPEVTDPGPVKLGYLLIAGESQSTRDLAPQGDQDPGKYAGPAFEPIAAERWEWIGPFGGDQKTTGNPTPDLHTVFPPEAEVAPGVAPVEPAEPRQWKRVTGPGERVNLAELTGWSDRGVCYARTTIHRDQAGPVTLGLRLDYFAKVWVNGKLVRTIDAGHGSPRTMVMVPVDLRQGDNAVLVKVHSGSLGNSLSMFLGASPAAGAATEPGH